MRTRNEQDAPKRDSRSGLDRRLTVTYYVVPQQLRTVSIPVRRINALLASLAVMVVWGAGTAAYFGYALYAVVSGDPAAAPASASMQAVIESQAAPTSAGPQAAMPEVGLPEVAAATDTEAAKTTVEPPVNDVWASQPAPVATASAVVAPREPTQGKVVEATLARTGDHLNVRFAIVNESAGVANGRVWGVVEYRGNDGELRRIASHAGVNPLALDSSNNDRLGLFYKARRRSNKSLAFELPTDVDGKVETVSIVTTEKYGNAVSITRVAVQP